MKISFNLWRAWLLVASIFCFIGCKEKRKYHDQKQDLIITQSGDTARTALSRIRKFQQKLNKEFRDPETTPLPDRYKKNFESLDFFTPDTTYIISARFVRTPNALPFSMPTTTDRTSREVVYGIAHFELHGAKHQLEIYQNKELIKKEGYRDYLFLPFTDQTNGEETYTGGRYLDLEIPIDDSIRLDFNTAYNPYCAYNKKFSCPIVPGVNALDTEVRAGVKAFKIDQ